jgi:hypothetical protein
LPGADGGPASLFGVSGIAATDQDALFVHGNELFWFQYDAGNPVLLGTYVVGLLPSSAETPISLVRQGPVALAAADTPNDFVLDAGTFTACVVLLGAGGMTDGGCLVDNGALVGADDAFLWVVGDGSGRLSAYGLDGGALIFVGSTPLSQQLTPPTGPFPLVGLGPPGFGTSRSLAPAVESDNVALQVFDLEQPLIGCNEQFAWEPTPSTDGGSALRVFVR